MPLPAEADTATTAPRSTRWLRAACCLVAMVYSATRSRWRDEGQAWGIAVDSDSLLTLFSHLKSETHPGLWHTILYTVAQMSTSSHALSVVQAVIAGALVWTIAGLALGKWERVLLLLSYYVAFEWTAFARPYGLAALLTLWFVRVDPRKDEHVWKRALLLACLANTTLMHLPVVFALAFEALFEQAGREGFRAATRRLAGAIAIVSFGVACALMSVLPSTSAAQIHPLPAFSGLVFVAGGYAPFPQSITPWSGLPALFTLTPLSCILIAVFLHLLAFASLRTARARLALLLGTIALAAAVTYAGIVPTRHIGQEFLLLVVLVLRERADGVSTSWTPSGSRAQRVAAVAFTSLLALQAASLATTLAIFRGRPISAVRDVTLAMSDARQRPCVVAVAPPEAAPTLALYLDAPIAMPQVAQCERFFPSDKKVPRFNVAALAGFVRQARAKGDILFLASTVGPEELGAAGVELPLVASATESLDVDERIYVYRLSADR